MTYESSSENRSENISSFLPFRSEHFSKMNLFLSFNPMKMNVHLARPCVKSKVKKEKERLTKGQSTMDDETISFFFSSIENMSLLATILPIIRTVFSRWTALQLAVSHRMGGEGSEAKYEAFIQAFGEFLMRNLRPASTSNEMDIQEYLDEILDEEFNTVLDDGSSYELAQLFLRYIHLILQGKSNEIQEELQLQQSNLPPVQMSVRNDDDSSSSSESEEEIVDKVKPQSMEIDEDGWTTVHRRK